MKKEKFEESTPERFLFDKDILTEKNFHELLLSHSYLDAVRSLAAGVTHNYNNIFGGLIGQFAILRRGDLSAEEREAAQVLIDGLLQRGAWLSSGLSFIRKKKDIVGSVAPAAVVHEVAELLGLLSSSHRIIPTAEPHLPSIRCAPQDLLLALFYLGRHAIEAMPEGGTVDISVRSGDERFDPLPSVVFAVKDHGRGIAEKDRERIFEPSFPSHQFGNAQEIDLGLYLVKNYALGQHGVIELDAEVDRGSVFRLILPAVPPSRSGEIDCFGKDLAQPAPEQEDSGPEIGGPQVILVVEDEEAMRLLITRLLQNTGNIVFSVQDGREAIEEYSDLHETISTVIMDAGLPDMTGQKCVRRLMEIDPNLTVLYMSGNLLEGHELYPANASLLLKPFNENDLHRAIGNARKRNSTQLS